MSYFFYHVVDNTSKIRMGYLEATDADAVRALFQKASVTSIEDIVELEKPTFYGERILIYFEGAMDNKLWRGTIEATSEQHALETLQKKLSPLIVRALSTKNLDQIPDLKDIYQQTSALFEEQKAAESEVQVPVIVEHVPEKEQDGTQSTIIDFKYKELLLFVASKLTEIGRDPAYVSIVAEIASVVFMQKEKSSTTLEEKYETLHALMREIALIEDELDPTPLKSDLREAIEKMVPFLQQIEKLQLHISTQKEILETKEEAPRENMYDRKRKEVQRLHKELETLQQSTPQTEEMVDISVRSVFIAELPKLLKWICIAGIGVKILSDLAYFTVFQKVTATPSALQAFVTTLSTHTFFTKALITATGLYLLLAIYERFWKKYYVIMLSLLGFLLLLFFLAVSK